MKTLPPDWPWPRWRAGDSVFGESRGPAGRGSELGETRVQGRDCGPADAGAIREAHPQHPESTAGRAGLSPVVPANRRFGADLNWVGAERKTVGQWG